MNNQSKRIIYEIKDLKCLKVAGLPDYIKSRAIKRQIVLDKIEIKSGWVNEKISFLALGLEHDMKLFKNDLTIFEQTYNKVVEKIKKTSTYKM